MNTRLIQWSETFNILTETQFGFRPGRGTVDCIFLLQGLIEKILNEKGSIFVAFIDYQKAFDYLDRSAMWAKLIKNGVSSKFIRIFQSLYEKMKLEVRNSPNEDMFSSNVGILQGEISSPLFFSFFVNDIESIFDSDNSGINIFDTLL